MAHPTQANQCTELDATVNTATRENNGREPRQVAKKATRDVKTRSKAIILSSVANTGA